MGEFLDVWILLELFKRVCTEEQPNNVKLVVYDLSNSVLDLNFILWQSFFKSFKQHDTKSVSS